MNLMSVTTDFKSLEKKYDNFSAPAVEVVIWPYRSTKLMATSPSIFVRNIRYQRAT